MTTLMILGAGLSQRPMYQTALDLGVEVLGADPDPHAPALALAHQVVVCDLADSDALLQAARRAGIAGALTVAADYPMPALSRLWSELGLPGPTAAAVKRATHKGEMRAALVNAGVPSPASRCVNSVDEVWGLVRLWEGVELIVKPAQSSGGRGVTRLSGDIDERMVEWAYAHAARFSPDRRAVVVEHFVDGPEYSIESVAFNGQHHVVAATDKLTSGAPHFVEIGHHQPASLSDTERVVLEEVACRAVSALGIDNAVCHTEVKLTAQGPVVIECAARAGGGFITSHLVPLSTGIDLMDAAIRIALGEAPQLHPPQQERGMATAIRFIVGNPGRITAIHGAPSAAAMEGVVDVQLYKHIGDNLLALQDATARCGHAIAVGADVESAVARACAARDAIRVVTRPA